MRASLLLLAATCAAGVSPPPNASALLRDAIDLPAAWAGPSSALERTPPLRPVPTVQEAVGWHARALKALGTSCRAGVSDCEAHDAMRSMFCERLGGVVMELGGLDGKLSSESLPFERVMHSQRLIVDANPTLRQRRRSVSPGAIGVQAAICSTPGVVHYLSSEAMPQIGGIAEFMEPRFLASFHDVARALFESSGRSWARVAAVDAEARAAGRTPPIPADRRITPVTCVPLSALFAHLGLRWIDFAILDVEGAELSLLRTIDWARVSFGVLVIEVGPPKYRPAGYQEQVLEFVERASPGTYESIYPGAVGRNVWLRHRNFTLRACLPRATGVVEWTRVADGRGGAAGPASPVFERPLPGRRGAAPSLVP